MSLTLLDIFRTLDQPTKDALADIGKPLLLYFAVLDIAQTKGNVERLTAGQIANCVEAANIVDNTASSVAHTLAKAGKRLSAKKDASGVIHYKLMMPGRREIAGILDAGPLAIVRIEGSKPRTARARLGELLQSLQGEIKICDPWYGEQTLNTLDLIPKPCRVEFLTAKTNEGRRLQRALKDFKKERPRIEFRIASSSAGLHDRYIVTGEALLLLGHGLKDLGNKESFIIRLNQQLVPDLLREVVGAFDSHWTNATPL